MELPKQYCPPPLQEVQHISQIPTPTIQNESDTCKITNSENGARIN